jgi:hypothetical protein
MPHTYIKLYTEIHCQLANKQPAPVFTDACSEKVVTVPVKSISLAVT